MILILLHQKFVIATSAVGLQAYHTSNLSALETFAHNSPSLVHRGFFLDALAADESVKAWGTVIGSRREMEMSLNAGNALSIR